MPPEVHVKLKVPEMAVVDTEVMFIVPDCDMAASDEDVAMYCPKIPVEASPMV